MTARTWFHDDGVNAIALPPGSDDIRMSDALVTRYIEKFSEPGDLVLDPFAGFGTTLVVAESLGRRAVGFELDPDRAAFAAALG